MQKLNVLNGNDSIYFDDLETVKFLNDGLVVDCIGENNKILIGKGVRINNLKIYIRSNNSVIKIGNNVSITGTIIMKLADNNTLEIGENTSIGGASFICCESKSIIIGQDCMIAWGIEFRTTDSHAIFDTVSNQRINPAADIILEDHVWVGAQAIILKGSVIPEGSIVGIRALVNKEFEKKNIILGGIPAKIIKENIYWERPLLG